MRLYWAALQTLRRLRRFFSRDSGPSWHLQGALLVNDSFLIRYFDERAEALLGPGVAVRAPGFDVDPFEDDVIDDRWLWRQGRWFAVDDEFDPHSPNEIETLTVLEASDIAGERWSRWVMDETERVAAQLLAAVQPIGRQQIPEDMARRHQQMASVLREQGIAAFPARSWNELGDEPEPWFRRPQFLDRRTPSLEAEFAAEANVSSDSELLNDGGLADLLAFDFDDAPYVAHLISKDWEIYAPAQRQDTEGERGKSPGWRNLTPTEKPNVADSSNDGSNLK